MYSYQKLPVCVSLYIYRFQMFHDEFSKNKSNETTWIYKNERSNVKKYMEACVEVCWHLQVNHSGAELVWKGPEINPKKEEFICKTNGCKKTSSCDIRVYVPSVSLNGQVLSPGKYSCHSCNPSGDASGERGRGQVQPQSGDENQTLNEAKVHVPGEDQTR
jgi:hypothetical protein